MEAYLRPGNKVLLGPRGTGHVGTVSKILIHTTSVAGRRVVSSPNHYQYLIRDDKNGALRTMTRSQINRA